MFTNYILTSPKELTSLKESMYEYVFKFIVIGNSGVGKTSLVTKFVKKRFPRNTEPTFGVDFISKIVTLPDNKKIKLQIWDTAGSEIFHSLTQSYYHGSVGIILMYDVTNMRSFIALKNWIQEIKVNKSENATVILVANKTDLKYTRIIEYEEGKKLADESKMLFTETSAKQGNCKSMFETLTENIYSKMLAKHKLDSHIMKSVELDSINLGDLDSARNCTCCSW
uniref:Ras-related GTPase n=1 Tax=Pithovirus LCDPAC01 TaxID=2506600 RepID=A0A481YMG6_9VIRU|nr:MAG: Ras-related GTPase [Pithovirus LCDPAC01]